ncbi:tigger transposable element-derived protein 7-like [Argopecten irradians]|uniref:tigger transposable element-derived protein 7-like n=1 Tax=Argopecten irradians TaxID=31199 RepID=UPI0037239B1B
MKKQFGDNISDKRKRYNSGSTFNDLNTLVLKWFEQARAKNLPLSGPIIQEKALQLVNELGLTEFKASNGWLDSFKERNNIGFFKISGESADVDDDVVNTYKKRLPEIVCGYEPKDVFNCDETGLFFRILPDKTFAKKGKSCKGGKLPKERLTVMLACSETGEKLKPLVIGWFPVADPLTEGPDEYDPDDDIPLAQLMNNDRVSINDLCVIEEDIETEETFSGEWESDLVQNFLEDKNVDEDEDDDDEGEINMDSDGSKMTYREVYGYLQTLFAFAAHTDERYLQPIWKNVIVSYQKTSHRITKRICSLISFELVSSSTAVISGYGSTKHHTN